MAEDWKEKVSNDDVVLIPGDISWAMKLSEATQDLNDICDMPGIKILLKGNHDYWWSSISRVREILFNNTYVLQNDAMEFEDIFIAGTRGWICPHEREFKAEDEKIYLREVERLKLSLLKIDKSTNKEIIVMMHFPPFNEDKEESGFTDLFKEFNVKKVIYGHLHDASAAKSFNGVISSVEYKNVSCDYLDFKLYQVK